MARKLTAKEQVSARRAARREAKAAALPPVPQTGGAFIVGADGALAPDPAQMPLETASKEA